MAFTSSSVGGRVSVFAMPIKLAAKPFGFDVGWSFGWSDRSG
ncbi:hypothetical protein [Nostoc commune]|nr:hypothetical protein [Nostoc commune]